MKPLLPVWARLVVAAGLLAALVYWQSTQQLDREYIEAGDRYFSAENYRVAEQNYEQALHFNPNDGETWRKLSVVRQELGDRAGIGEALRHIEADLTLEDARLLMALGGQIYLDEQYPDAEMLYRLAIEVFERVRADPSELANAYVQLGRALINTESCKTAMPQFLHAQELAPDSDAVPVWIDFCRGR